MLKGGARSFSMVNDTFERGFDNRVYNLLIWATVFHIGANAVVLKPFAEPKEGFQWLEDPNFTFLQRKIKNYS